MSPRVLTTSFAFGGVAQSARTLLEDAGCEIIDRSSDDVKALDEEQLLEVVPDVDAILCGVDPISARVIDVARRLRVIARFGVGYDSVDLTAANVRSIYVTNTPGILAQSVADYAFALLAACARRVPYTDRSTKAGKWAGVIGADIHGKTLGVIGLGEIGLEVARRATGFGMRIIYFDVRDVDTEFTRDNNVHRVELETLLKESDFVSIHCSLSSATRGILSAQRLDLMKPSAILVNTARGGLVDEQRLFQKLRDGSLAGAALDVFEQEPPDTGRFADLENFIATTHSGAFSLETITRMAETAAQSIVDVLAGNTPTHWVNRDFT